MLRIVAWKELLELSRDRRTLAAVVLMPLLGLPGLGLLTGALYHQQVAVLGVYYSDDSAASLAGWLASRAREAASSMGLNLVVNVSKGVPRPACCTVFVYLPPGIGVNASSLSRPVKIYVGRLIASQAADAAYAAVRSAINDYSRILAVERVERLASVAGLTIDPAIILDPVVVVEETFKPSGATATEREQLAAETARMLQFALIFVVNPAVVYVTDAIVGERERRTLEALLASPLGIRDVIAGKMVAASLIGFIAALADSMGVIIFFGMLGGALELPPGLLALHALVAGVLVVMTSALIAPIAARSPSIRSAQAAGMAALGVATAIYFAALFTDLFSLPAFIEAVLLTVPFTHAALAIQAYAVGDTLRMAGHLAFMGLVAILGTLAAVRFVDREKMIFVK